MTKIFCFSGDNPLDKKRFNDSNSWIRKSIPIYDAYFIWTQSLVKKLKDAGAKKAFYLPVGYDPTLHYPVKCDFRDKKKYSSDVAFIGTWDEDREDWLNELAKYDLKIWGNSWGRGNHELQKKWTKIEAVGEEFSKICACSKIIINFVRKPEIPSHNMRNFEIPASKGFQLCNRTGEVLNFLEEGKDIACFDSKKEMKEKINFYLKNPKERKKIIENSYKKIKNHTYLDRVKNILNIYNELNSSTPNPNGT